MRKTWQQELDSGMPPRVQVTERAFTGVPAGAKMLISSPAEFRDFIAEIPKGESVSILELRDTLAKRHRAKVMCPVTTRIFLRIVAEAALDELDSGKSVKKVTPFRRVVSPKGKVAKRIRCGPEFIRARREAEEISGD